MGHQPVVPHPGGRISHHVGVELGILNLVAQVVVVPRTGGQLRGEQPLVGGFGLVEVAGYRQGHCRLDVVPRVGMPPREPGDHPVG